MRSNATAFRWSTLSPLDHTHSGWQGIWHTYDPHYPLVALTVAGSLAAWCCSGLPGLMLPFVLRGCGLDPTSASAPFGLVIYFTVATVIMRSTLL
jgi:magnesium transporter